MMVVMIVAVPIGRGCHLLAAILCLLLFASLCPPASAQKSHAAYLETLVKQPIRTWNFAPWNAVFHPIDYWIRHSSSERSEASRKLTNFLRGREILPEKFSRVRIPAGDMTLSGALYLADERPRPLVVLIPGTFGSHLSSYLADTGRLLARTGKFHVLLLASRMSTVTIREMKVLGSGGYFEGQDILAAIRWIRGQSPWADLVSRAGIFGVSLSADFVVQAMAHDSGRVIQAGLVVSGAYDPLRVAAAVDAKARGSGKVRHPWAWLFQKALKYHLGVLEESLGTRLAVGDVGQFTLSDFAPRLSWPFYRAKLADVLGHEPTYDEFIALNTALNLVHRVKAPLLAIHSHRDEWMGFEHAERFQEVARSNPRVALHFVDVQGHATYYLHDPEWFANLLDSYYSYWLEAPAPARAYNPDAPEHPRRSAGDAGSFDIEDPETFGAMAEGLAVTP